MNHTISELEALAYLSGDTDKVSLLARISELELQVEALTDKLDDAESNSLARWERNNGPASEYKQFFFDCFARLDGVYPCVSVTSDYDKSIIYAAIQRGEGVAE